MINVNIITNPDNLSPILNSPVWFRLDSASSSLPNFKYVVRLNYEPEPFINSFEDLQIYKLPPRPFGECEYTPNKMLESFFGYKTTPFINNWTASNNALLNYNINYGFEYSPNFSFTGTFNSGGFLGLSFSSQPDIKVADVIKIQKVNKQVNIGYDGFSSVTGTGSNSIITNLSFGLTQSDETGIITSLLRLNATSSNYEAIYATRQYDERTKNFSEYIIGLTESGDFLTENKQSLKPTLLTDYETLSFVLSATQGYSMFLRTYGNSNNLLNTYSYDIPTSNEYKRMDFGVGPQNILNNIGTSSTFFDDINYYTWNMESPFTINVDYSTATYSNSTSVYPSGNYNGYVYYNWNDGINTFFIWYSTSGVRWEVTSSLGGGNQRLTSSFPFSDKPPVGSMTSSVWLNGADPIFDTFNLTTGAVVSEFKKYKLDVNCTLGENVRLVWLNRLGGWDYFNFKLGGKKSITIERNTFKKVLPYNYSFGDRQDTTYSQKVDEIWSIQSNWITEEESEWLQGLIESREVYHIIDTYIYPIQILDKSYERKQSVRDIIFNLTVQFKYAYNRVI